jgi:hypothetical protein
MIVTRTVASEELYLFADSPNLGEPPRVTHRLKTTIQRSLTDRESRWPRWGAPRTQLTYTYDLQGAEAADVRTMLYNLGTKRSAVPLWHDARPRSDWANRIYEPQYVLDVEGAAIVPVADIGTIASDHQVAPLVLCRFDRPETEVEDIDFGRFPFSFTEQSPWSWRCTIRDRGLSSSAFPGSVEPDYISVEDRSKDRLEFEELGDGREPVVYGDEAPMRWGQEASFTLEEESLGDLLSFWAHGATGRAHAFTVDQLFKPHTQATPETPDGYMARFADDALTLTFEGLRVAQTAIRFWHLPWELNPPAGEEFECTPYQWLYEFIRITPDNTEIASRFTDGEADTVATIDGSPETFTAAAITHSGPDISMQEAHSSVDLRMVERADNPLVPWYRRQGEGRLTLNLYRTDGTPVLVFAGELGEVGLDRNIYTADFGAAQRRKVPRVVMTRKDNHSLYAPEGGFSWQGYELEGEIVDNWTSPKVWIDLPGGGLGADEMIGGWIRVGSGATCEDRMVLFQATGGATSDWVFDLDKPLVHAQAGQAVFLRPGYDRTWESAKSFGLYYGHHNFLGFPQLPVTDPSAEAGTPEPNIVGKK